MKKIILLLSLNLFVVAFVNAQIKWITFEEAIELNKKAPKKILIDVYTDWCGYCKVMDKNTFSDPKVAEMINKNFYPVKFNAESKEEVTFSGRKFVFKPEYKAHELAVVILNGRMGYPSIAYMDENNQVLTVVPGYQKPEQLRPVLEFISGNHYKTVEWEKFAASYKE